MNAYSGLAYALHGLNFHLILYKLHKTSTAIVMNLKRFLKSLKKL